LDAKIFKYCYWGGFMRKELIYERNKEIQHVDVSILIPKFMKQFGVKPYSKNLRRKIPFHYNSMNSNLDYRA